MKFGFKNIKFLIFSCLLFSFCIRVDALTTYTPNEYYPFSVRNKQSIVDEYNKYFGDIPDNVLLYSVEPTSSNVGELSSEMHKYMTDYVNFYRWLYGTGYLDGVSNRYSAGNDMQAGAMVRYYHYINTGSLVHNGSGINNDFRPSSMDINIWNTGVNCQNNILAAGFGTFGAIDKWINEGYYVSSNYFDPNELGHRMALISPRRSHVDFGYYGNLAIGRVESVNTMCEDFLTFPPPGYMPNNFISAYGSAWHVEFNKNHSVMITDDTAVTVTNMRTKEGYTCRIGDCAKRDKYDPETLLYKQPTPTYSGTYSIGDKYHIHVSGLKRSNGESAEISYTTEFFDIEKPDAKADETVNKISANIKNKVYYSSKVDRNDFKSSLDLTGSTLTLTFADAHTEDIALTASMITINDTTVYDSVRLNIKYEDAVTYAYVFIVNDYKKYSQYGNKLKDVYLSNINYGTQSWVKGENTSVGNAGIHQFEILVTPYSYYYSDPFTYTVDVEVSQINPEYTVPSIISVPWKANLSSVLLPHGWSWENPNLVLYTLSDSTYAYGLYTPDDSINYRTINTTIPIKVINNFPPIETPNLIGECGATLKEVALPDSSDGTYSWVDSVNTSIGCSDTNNYRVKYVPKDSQYATVEFYVPVSIKAGSYMKGDLNKDGKVNLSDILLELKIFFNSLKPNDTQKLAGDMNSDNKIDLSDVLLLLKKFFAN